MEDGAEDADADSRTFYWINNTWHNLSFYEMIGYAFLRPVLHMRR